MRPRTKKTIGYSILVLLIIAGAAAIYIYKEYNRRVKDTSLLKSAYSLQSKDLVKEFESNDSIAGRKYMDKVIEVSGNVREMITDEKGYITVVLGDSSTISAVRCSVDTLHHAEMTGLKEGAATTMKGICSGFNKDELLGSDVILVRSVLATKK